MDQDHTTYFEEGQFPRSNATFPLQRFHHNGSETMTIARL
jgi:hypothetical protein